MGELHLEIIVDRMKREFKVEANIGAPQVAYRETISRRAEIDYTHKKQTGGSGQFARVKIRFEPLPPGSGYRFVNDVVGGNVPEEFIPGVAKGLEASLEHGVLAGFPVIDFKATLYDGAYHDADSSALAFEIAARGAFRQSMQKAGPTLLEPVMRVEVVVPRKYDAKLVADLSRRRGSITGQEQCSDAEVISALVPLVDLFGYADALATLTNSAGTWTMRFDHYAPAPFSDPDPRFPAANAVRT
jgi:elongation factor G